VVATKARLCVQRIGICFGCCLGNMSV
jgi:hypothetical protein